MQHGKPILNFCNPSSEITRFLLCSSPVVLHKAISSPVLECERAQHFLREAPDPGDNPTPNRPPKWDFRGQYFGHVFAFWAHFENLAWQWTGRAFKWIESVPLFCDSWLLLTITDHYWLLLTTTDYQPLGTHCKLHTLNKAILTTSAHWIKPILRTGRPGKAFPGCPGKGN